jgi:hypothetical protein
VARNETPSEDHRFASVTFARGEPPTLNEETLAAKTILVSQHDQPDAGWHLEEDTGRALFAKLMAAGKPLGEVGDGQMYRGVLTGLNEAFLVTRPRVTKSSARTRPPPST